MKFVNKLLFVAGEFVAITALHGQRFLARFCFSKGERQVVKRHRRITKTSVTDFIYLLMSNTGMTQEQAATTLDSILAYMKQHSSDPLARLSKFVFGSNRDNENASLN